MGSNPTGPTISSVYASMKLTLRKLKGRNARCRGCPWGQAHTSMTIGVTTLEVAIGGINGGKFLYCPTCTERILRDTQAFTKEYFVGPEPTPAEVSRFQLLFGEGE